MDEASIVRSLWILTKVILDSLDFHKVVQEVCDGLLRELGFSSLGYRIIVLSLYDVEKNGLQRISLSQTEEAKAATSVSTIPFEKILIPITAEENICVKAFKDKIPYFTHDWKDILSPPLLPDDARYNQKAAGIGTSMVYPLVLRGDSVGVIIFSMVKDVDMVTQTEKDLIAGFTDIVSIAVQNAKLYSDLSKTTKELNEANKRLLELDKMKDEFISIASHELRSPAAVVKDYLWSVLNEAKDLAPDVRSDVEKAVAANQRLIQLVNDLLDISRIEGGRLEIRSEEFELKDLVIEINEERKYGLTLKLADGKVIADRDKTRQVIVNLVDNAIKYSGNKPVELVLEAGEMMKVMVKDHGIGIDPAQKDKLFSKFGRLDTLHTEIGKVGGTGLGLFICKRIVELSGGQMGFESEYGQGSSFWFTLKRS